MSEKVIPDSNTNYGYQPSSEQRGYQPSKSSSAPLPNKGSNVQPAKKDK